MASELAALQQAFHQPWLWEVSGFFLFFPIGDLMLRVRLSSGSGSSGCNVPVTDRWRPVLLEVSCVWLILLPLQHNNLSKSSSTSYYLLPLPFSSTVFALKTSNRGFFSLHTIFIPFMSVAGWHKTFMAPFHTLISCDIPFVLFRLDFEHDNVSLYFLIYSFCCLRIF